MRLTARNLLFFTVTYGVEMQVMIHLETHLFLIPQPTMATGKQISLSLICLVVSARLFIKGTNQNSPSMKALR